MSDRQVAPPAGRRNSGPSGNAAAPRSRWARVGPLLSGRPVRWGFVAVTVGLGGYAVAREWTSVRAALGDLGFVTVAAALLSVLAAMVMTMQAWRVLLAGLGSPLPVRPAARIMFIGQLGKYLPGSVWPVLAQMELGHAYQVPRHRSASASVLAMVVSLLSGLLTALVTLPFVAGATAYRWAFALIPVLLAGLHPQVLNAILGRLLRVARRPPLDQPLTGRVMAGALAWSCSSWVLYGLQIWLLATRLGAPAGRTALLAAGGFAFAWSVGFLVVFAPAGAGVRDVLLIAVLGPVLGVGSATAVALVSRALMTAGDLLTAGLAAVSSRAPHPRAGKPGDGETRQALK
jgi:glycosyltransferase 2 family protein